MKISAIIMLHISHKRPRLCEKARTTTRLKKDTKNEAARAKLLEEALKRRDIDVLRTGLLRDSRFFLKLECVAY